MIKLKYNSKVHKLMKKSIRNKSTIINLLCITDFNKIISLKVNNFFNIRWCGRYMTLNSFR